MTVETLSVESSCLILAVLLEDIDARAAFKGLEPDSHEEITNGLMPVLWALFQAVK